jgi:hypothetical protein
MVHLQVLFYMLVFSEVYVKHVDMFLGSSVMPGCWSHMHQQVAAEGQVKDGPGAIVMSMIQKGT